jgi:hypothetical protein
LSFQFDFQICFAWIFESRNYFEVELIYYWSNTLYSKILYVHQHIWQFVFGWDLSKCLLDMVFNISLFCVSIIVLRLGYYTLM